MATEKAVNQGWFRTFLCGLCMGAADIVPGISGGTIAFIMGFYTQLLASIKSIDRQAITDLLRFRFHAFQQRVQWRFLLPLGMGIACSFAGLAQLIQFLLANQTYRTLLYAGFLGLIIASTLFCLRQISRWEMRHFLFLVLGIVTAFLLTDNTFAAKGKSLFEIGQIYLINWSLVICGMIAISAMLLPGISGSYLLTILGVYPGTISAVSDFTKALQHGSFDGDAFLFLANIGLGIVVGGLLFARVVDFLFRYYEQNTIALMIGFMIGALRSVWPFWSYLYVIDPMHVEKGTQLQPDKMVLPDLLTPLFGCALLCMLAGFLLVFWIERKNLKVKADA